MTKDKARQLAHESLHVAIQMMREACDDAESAMKHAMCFGENPARATQFKLRCGFLNALAGIETAQSYLDEGKPE